jgi:cyclopropane-fatty-acyl-phospholipid synthase
MHTVDATVAAMPETGSDVARTCALLDAVFPPPRDFVIRLWDGTRLGGESGARYTVVLHHPGTARRMFSLPLELALGEALIHGDFDIEGDFFASFDLKERARAAVRTPGQIFSLLRLRQALPTDSAGRGGRGPARLSGHRHSQPRDRSAIQYHYDVGNDFYALWLDERMVYSCAYFPTGTEDLATAQRNKLEHVCRKLRLRPGERLLDIGCGWGALCLYAAQEYGVRALGVTLSEQQHQLASERVAAAGLADRVKIELLDYRAVSGEFDKVASIGMFEHVGSRYTEYFSHVHRLLKPGGLFLNHSIAAPPQAEAWARQPSIRRLFRRYILGTGLIRERYIFPDGELIPVSEANLIAERAGFEVRDLENLREHYALTLRQWVARLEARRETAVRVAGESVYRTWRLYLSAAALEFEKGSVNVNQTLFARPLDGLSRMPLSRADLYR